MNLKKTVLTLSVASMLALTGCSSMMGGSAEDTQKSWAKFLENTPTFETQVVTDTAVSAVFDSVAGFAKAQHEAVLAIDKLASTPGGQIEMTFNELVKNGQVADRATYEKQLTKEEIKAWKAYQKDSKKIVTARVKQGARALEACAGFYVIYQDPKGTAARIGINGVMDTMNFVSKVKTVYEQAVYIKESVEWFNAIDAQIKNAANSSGQK